MAKTCAGLDEIARGKVVGVAAEIHGVAVAGSTADSVWVHSDACCSNESKG